MRLEPRELILTGKYRVERALGRGAFAEVYVARHVALGVERAVKVLAREAPGVGSTVFDDYQARFEVEAQLGARIDHPNVIKIYDFEGEEDARYLVMEHAPAGSLADVLKRDGPLAMDEFVRIAEDTAAGLGAIHQELQIVHRDIKPSNILLTEDGHAKIGDLGLAQVEGGMSQRSMLGSEAVPHPGTPLYMSPEQEREHGYLRFPSDVYGLGCVMFEMLTGKRYKNQRPGTRVGELRDEVPAWLDDLVADCTGEERYERPWDGNEVAELLGERNRKPTVLRPQSSRASPEREILRPQSRRAAPEPLASRLRRAESGLVIATPENVADLLQMTDPLERVWWEKAKMELCLVPAGGFLMGSPEGEGHSDEYPQHTVHLDVYYIGRYPVTNAEYARFLSQTGRVTPDGSGSYEWVGGTPPRGKGQHPVVIVSWHDAAAYCRWPGLFLPTEAEWEKAARGTDGRRYPRGDQDPTDRLCNFNDNVGGTTPVGTYSPQGNSPYGCGDMASNVLEWCADRYAKGYYAQSPDENPTRPSSGKQRVFRGGSWGSPRTT